MHCDSAWSPPCALYVPGGQGDGIVAPASQKKPRGHNSPVTPSMGAVTLADPAQKYPAVQSGPGFAMPSVGQYLPAGHGVH